MKKILIVLVFSLALGGALSTPHKVHAQIIDPVQSLKEVGVDTLVTILDNRILDKLVNDALNWSSGGFDGDPGFLNNWDGFLEGVAQDTLSVAFHHANSYANSVVTNYQSTGLIDFGFGNEGYSQESYTNYQNCIEENTGSNPTAAEQEAAATGCQDLLVPASLFSNNEEEEDSSEGSGSNSNTGNNSSNQNNNVEYSDCIEGQFEGDPANATAAEMAAAEQACQSYLGNALSNALSGAGNDALNNWNLQNSGNLDSSRSVAENIQRFASTSLNADKRIDQLIAGEGETLTKLLGSKTAVDNFKRGDLQSGGWNAYIALGDPHNNAIGRQGLINSALEKKSRTKLEKKLADLQTPQKFFNKTKCLEYKKDPEGKDTKECLREEIQTPANQVSAKVDNGLHKETRRLELGRELSDVLAAAVGKLATGLLQQGFSDLSKKISNAGDDAGNAASAVINGDQNPFANVFQNDYDILGIGSGPANEPTGNNSATTEAEEDLTGVDLNSTTLAKDPSIPAPSELERLLNIEVGLQLASINTKEFIRIKTLTMREARSVKVPVKNLDRCLPGPDFGWEQRFTDLIDTEGQGYGKKFENADKDGGDGSSDENTDDETAKEKKYTSPGVNAQANKLAFSLAKSMSKDPRLNIPGFPQMKSLVNSYLRAGNDTASQLRSDIETKQKSRFIVNQLLGKVQVRYKSFRNTLAQTDTENADLWSIFPIYEEDWNDLSEDQKINLLSIEAHPNNLPELESNPENTTYLLEASGSTRTAMVLSEFNGETPAAFLENDPLRARDVILQYAWYIWRQGMDALPAEGINLSGKDQADNVLRFFYTVKNEIATDLDVTTADVEYEKTLAGNQLIRNYEHDCNTFRDWIAQTAGYPDRNSVPYKVAPDYQRSGYFGFKNYGSSWPTNPTIKAKLKEIQELQNNELPLPDNLDLRTDALTAQANIDDSILGKSTAEIEAYYNDFYTLWDDGPSDDDADAGKKGLEGHYRARNKVSSTHPVHIVQMLMLDNIQARFKQKKTGWQGQTGLLFCYTDGEQSLHKKGKADSVSYMVSECLKPWYYTKDIEYDIIFSDIQ